MKKQMLQLGSTAFLAVLLLGVALPRCDDLEALCESAADISAQTEIRCGVSANFEVAKQAFKDKMAYGDCKSIKHVRDAKALIEECLPWLQTASCSLIFEQGRVLPACLNQFGTIAK